MPQAPIPQAAPFVTAQPSYNQTQEQIKAIKAEEESRKEEEWIKAVEAEKEKRKEEDEKEDDQFANSVYYPAKPAYESLSSHPYPGLAKEYPGLMWFFSGSGGGR